MTRLIVSNTDNCKLPFTRIMASPGMSDKQAFDIAFSMFGGWSSPKDGDWSVNLSTCWKKDTKGRPSNAISIKEFIRRFNVILAHELVHLAGENGELGDGHSERWDRVLEKYTCV